MNRLESFIYHNNIGCFIPGRGMGVGLSCRAPASLKMQERHITQITESGLETGGYKMEKEYRIKTLLNDVEKEFEGLDHYQRAKLAIEQISMWQQKFNQAKVKILKENIVDATPANGMIGQYPEVEA